MKILIVEDQAMFRDFLAWACESANRSTTVLLAEDGKKCLEYAQEGDLDLIILDLELPDCDGLSLVDELRDKNPQSKIIVLSCHIDEVSVYRVFRSNVEGYVDKNQQPIETLREAIHSVSSGKRYLSPLVRELWQRLREQPNSFDKILSDREQQVIALIGRGYTNPEIADVLKLSVHTVQNHRSSIMSKLDIHSTSHLIRYATEKGFTR